MRALVRQEKQKRTLACDVPELADIMRVVGADIRAVLRGAHVKIVCPKPCAWESLPLTFLEDVMHRMVAKPRGWPEQVAAKAMPKRKPPPASQSTGRPQDRQGSCAAAAVNAASASPASGRPGVKDLPPPTPDEMPAAEIAEREDRCTSTQRKHDKELEEEKCNAQWLQQGRDRESADAAAEPAVTAEDQVLGVRAARAARAYLQ